MSKKTLIPNSTGLPNVIMDVLIPALPEGAVRCLLYISRRTYGFHKKRDRISLSQFVSGIKDSDGNALDLGTGLSRQGVVTGLELLSKVGIITTQKERNCNYYEINIDGDLVEIMQNIINERSLKMSAKQSTNLTSQLNRLVNLIDQSSQLSRPKVVNLVDTQKKGKESKKESNAETSSAPAICSFETCKNKAIKNNLRTLCEDHMPMSVRQFVAWTEKSPCEHIKIISVWADTVSGNLIQSTVTQWKHYISRNSRTAKRLTAYSMDQLEKAYEKIEEMQRNMERSGKSFDPSLETLEKQLTK